MKLVKYLLPSYFRKIGWIAVFPCMAGVWFLQAYSGMWGLMEFGIIPGQDPENWHLTSYLNRLFQMGEGIWWDELAILGVVLSLIFIAFSKEKAEDEYVWKIRMESLVWAFIVDALLIVAATLLLFGQDYVVFMFLNFYIILVLFIAKFRIALFRTKKSLSHEE